MISDKAERRGVQEIRKAEASEFEKLYEGFGFRKIQTLPMYYEDTGLTEFELYELEL